MGWVISITPRPRFTPGERTPGTHCRGGWVGPRAGLDTEDRWKILCPCRGSNPDRPVVQPVVRHYTAWANTAPIKTVEHLINSTFILCKYNERFNLESNYWIRLPYSQIHSRKVIRKRVPPVCCVVFCFVFSCQDFAGCWGNGLALNPK
jgi:hypothetical protein